MRDTRADTRNAVHLTDLGSEVDPTNERQAPYSNVGQVSRIQPGFDGWYLQVLIEQPAFPH
jgi:hypothetical protein